MLPIGTSSSKSYQTVDQHILDTTGRKTALAAMSVVRGAIELLKALQQSGNHGQVPFAASWALVSLARSTRARWP